MAKVNPDFFADAYLFLPQVTRDLDESQNKLLERYLGGVQQLWEMHADNAEQLPTLFNVDTIADEWLPYLKWTVGWTSDLDHITRELSSDELRKLIRVSVDLWKTKGTEQGLRDALRLITGRDVMVWNWFRSRWVLEVGGIWRLGQSSDIILAGDEVSDRDEYLTVLWVMNEVGIQRSLIQDIVQLGRPLQEVYRVVYADLVDDFRLGRSKWLTDTGPDLTWDADRYRLIVEPGARAVANVPAIDAAQDVVWRMRAAFTSSSGGSMQMIFRWDANADDYYRATWNQDGTILLELVDGGIASTLGSATLDHILPEDETTVLGLNVSRPATGELTIEVFVYAEAVIAVDLTGVQVLPPGPWAVQNVAPGNVEIDDVIAYEFPVVVDTISASGVTTEGE